jgi:hypothetical protein
MDRSTATNSVRRHRNTASLRFLARAGFAVNGLVNATIGVIAIGIAVSGGGSADQSGAFFAISAAPGGSIILSVVALALAALALWYVLGSFSIHERDVKRRATKIVVECGKGIAYLALAGTAFGFVVSAGSDSSDQASSLTARLLATPGGIVLIVLIGILVVGIGIYMIRKGTTRQFERDLALPPGGAARGVKVLGIFGYVARGVALIIVGVLFIVASFTVDPSKATGLDGALKTLADLPFGRVLLVIVGLGFIAYGAYSAVRARLAKLD